MNCDKCGQPVARNNDAVVVHAIANEDPLSLLLYQARQFLPTDTCEGSPSRAQYIEGQPRDTRGYEYDSEYEQLYRSAYAQLQTRSTSG